MLPGVVKPALQAHLATVKRIHERDLREGFGRVELPYALARKYPAADKVGHANLNTTMIYTHVLNRGGFGVASPADHL